MEAVDGEVGGGEAEFAGELAAGDDLAEDRVGSAEEAGGGGEVALGDGLADAGAADGGAVEEDRGDGLRAKVEAGAEFGEGVKVAAAALSEAPVVAHGDGGEGVAGVGEAGDEGLWGEGGEGLVEGKDEEVGEAEGVQEAGLVRGGREEGGGGLRAQQLDGVRVKGEGHGGAALAGGGGLGAADHGLVAEVDAVKEADRQVDGAGEARQSSERVQGDHGSSWRISGPRGELRRRGGG